MHATDKTLIWVEWYARCWRMWTYRSIMQGSVHGQPVLPLADRQFPNVTKRMPQSGSHKNKAAVKNAAHEP
jgi:hypothetical protein